jgi:hypothetical protein
MAQNPQLLAQNLAGIVASEVLPLVKAELAASIGPWLADSSASLKRLDTRLAVSVVACRGGWGCAKGFMGGGGAAAAARGGCVFLGGGAGTMVGGEGGVQIASIWPQHHECHMHMFLNATTLTPRAAAAAAAAVPRWLRVHWQVLRCHRA